MLFSSLENPMVVSFVVVIHVLFKRTVKHRSSNLLANMVGIYTIHVSMMSAESKKIQTVGCGNCFDHKSCVSAK